MRYEQLTREICIIAQVFCWRKTPGSRAMQCMMFIFFLLTQIMKTFSRKNQQNLFSNDMFLTFFHASKSLVQLSYETEHCRKSLLLISPETKLANFRTFFGKYFAANSRSSSIIRIVLSCENRDVFLGFSESSLRLLALQIFHFILWRGTWMFNVEFSLLISIEIATFPARFFCELVYSALNYLTQ